MIPGADRQTDALVLSGGGAMGAYEIGVLKALFEGASPATGHRPLEVEVYTGTSVGAYNAAYMVSRSAVPSLTGVAELQQIWLQRFADTPEKCGNGVYRVRGAPLQLGDLACLRHPFNEFVELTQDALFGARYLFTRGTQFLASDASFLTRIIDSVDISALLSPEPLYESVRDTIDPAGLRASSRRLTIIASNWKFGVVRLFDRLDVADKVGPCAILASTALPGIFPPVDIDGIPYVDGGVLMNTPLRPAIRNGADVLHVIYLDPCVLNIPFPRYPDTFDTFYRLWAVLQSQAFRRDVRTVREINREMGLLRGLLGRIPEELPGEVAALAPFSRVLQRLSSGEPRYRELTLHQYRPKNDLGGAEGLLNFRQSNIESLIAAGYQDTVQHDCGEAGCVIPTVEPAPIPETAAAVSAARGELR